MNSLSLVVIIGLLSLWVWACTVPASESDSPAAQLPYMQPPPGNTHQWTLPDGTRCVYVNRSSFDGSLACDFQDAQMTLEQTIEQLNALGNAGSRQ